MAKEPKIIYLQFYGDTPPCHSDTCEICDGDVTWCRDKIFKSDLKYKLVQKRKRRKGANDQ